MVFGRQRPHKLARASSAPQVALVRQSIDRSGSLATGTKPLRRTAGIPVPETIAEDGCEVVPQFFPGVVPTNALLSPLSSPSPHTTNLRIDTNVHGSGSGGGGQYHNARTSSQRRAGSIKAASSAGSDGICIEENAKDLPGPRSAPPHQGVCAPRRSSNGSSISSAATFIGCNVSPPARQQNPQQQ
ncbi:hypothetical protein LPJ59_002588, partial [Coemansia sp. RSA 2399]